MLLQLVVEPAGPQSGRRIEQRRDGRFLSVYQPISITVRCKLEIHLFAHADLAVAQDETQLEIARANGSERSVLAYQAGVTL